MYRAKLTLPIFGHILYLQKYNKLEFFVEDDIYWAPASTTANLYSQLASKKYREIPINQLR